MPPLTKEQIEKAKYVSIADFNAKVDQIKDFDEKMKFATLYLLSHGMGGAKTDYTLEESIHLVRLKLVDESKKLRGELENELDIDPADLYIDEHPYVVNPYAENEKDDIENEFFMANPCEYLKRQAQKYTKELDKIEMEVGPQVSFHENCDRLSKTLDTQKSNEILYAEEKGVLHLNLKARMEAKCMGRENFLKLEKETRPGFFARNFGTRSNPGKNFDEVYAAFNNPKHALYGNLNALEKATTEYLAYKDSKKSPAERLAGLAVKEPKEGFASKLLDAIKEQKANDEIFKTVVGGCRRKNLDPDTVDRIKGTELEQNPNRIPITLDLDDENEMDSSMESESELDMEVQKEDEMEMQK